MVASRFNALLLVILAVTGCSKSPAAANNAANAEVNPGKLGQTPSAASSGSITIPIPAGQDVTKTVPLPAGTHSLGVRTGANSFSCDHVSIENESGNYSANFTQSVVPANLNMSSSAAGGHAYVNVDVQCRGSSAASELVITPSP